MPYILQYMYIVCAKYIVVQSLPFDRFTDKPHLHYRYHSLLSVPIPPSIIDSTRSTTAIANRTSDAATDHASMILYYVYSCLSAPGVSKSVCSCVMEMTVNLLSGWDGEESEKREVKLTTNAMADVLESVKEDARDGDSGMGMGMEIGNGTSGPELVLPLVPMLLSYMSGVIESESKRIKAGSNPKDLHLEFTVISK